MAAPAPAPVALSPIPGSFNPDDFEPVTVFQSNNGTLVAKYSDGTAVPLTGEATRYTQGSNRSLRVFKNGRKLLEVDGKFYAPSLEAPLETQPSPAGGAQNPSALPAPGQAPAPAPAAPAPASAAPATPAAQTQAATTVKTETYSDIHSGSYSDPPAASGTVVNVYELSFHEFWGAEGEHFTDSVELPYVSRVTMQAPNAVARTRSLTGDIYAEHASFVQRTFVIEGRSGPVWNDPHGPGDQLAISRFTALRNFLEKYGHTSARYKNALIRYKDPRLVLNCSFESESHFCDVVNFNYRRSAATSTYSFEYSLTLVTNGFANQKKWEPAGLISKSKAQASIATLDETAKALPRLQEEDLREAFDNAQSAFMLSSLSQAADFQFRLLESDVAFSKRNMLENMSCSSLRDLRLALSAVSILTDTSIFTAPFITPKQRADTKAGLAIGAVGLDLVHMFKGSTGVACPTPPWSDLYYNIVPYATAAATVVRYIIDAVGMNRGYDYTYKVINEPPVRPGLRPTANTGPERPFAAVNYFLPQNGADAYSIAQRVLGDINLYWSIIDLNNLRDAYTRADGTPLSPGSSVLIPSGTTLATKDEDVLGTDLLIVNGDLMLVGNNDIMRVSGYANYTQNLFHRMQTPRGTNRVFPNYGLPASIHSSASSTVPAMIRNDVRNQVRQDHRTEEVTNIRLTELGDKVQVDMVVKAVAGVQRSFKFNYNLNSQVTA